MPAQPTSKPSRLVANAHFMWAFCFLAQIWPISGPLLAHESRAFYLTTIGFWPSKPQDAFKFFKCDRVYKNLDTSCMNLITRTPKDIPAYGREPPHKYLSPTPAFETKRKSKPTGSAPESSHSEMAAFHDAGRRASQMNSRYRPCTVPSLRGR